jgi:benzoate membrane transport protein
MLLAPLGCYGITLAAITGAICCSKEADENAFSRYKSTLFAGLCWFIIGIFGSTIVAVFFAFPNELILTVAGLALFTTIGNSLKAALHDDIHREPALITILLSASGITLFGMGAAFWGLVGGIVASFILNWRKPDEAAIKVSLS